MAKVTAPDNIRIASMDDKKKEQLVNQMRAGKGMPWEDRGSIGLIGAFIKNVIQALTGPNALLEKMRRPETTGDSTSFAFICCSFWFLGAVVQSVFDYFTKYAPNHNYDITVNSYILNTVLVAVLCGGGAFVMLLIATNLYFKLTSHDMTSKAPPVLIRNILAYLMAPSVFALIPFSVSFIPVGPTLAILWILFLWIAAGKGRLQIRKGGAIVGPILTMLACVAIIFGAYFAVRLAAINMTSIVDNTVQVKPAPPEMTLASPISPSQDRLRRSLLHRIHRRYQTISQTCQFSAIELDFTRIADPDVVLDEVVAEEDRREKITGIRLQDPQHLPYWAQLWESAGGLASAIAHRDLVGKTVLDLGCGMGLAGVAAAACGANVLLADLEPPALLFARLNALPFANRVRVRQLNWQADHLADRFDLILGADIVYERKQWEFLEPFWREHLAPGGEILLAEPGRQTGDLFVEWIQQRSWKLTQSTQTSPVGEGKTVRIFQITRR